MADFDALKAQIAALIPDNTEQAITAKDVRDAFGDTIDAINSAKEDQGSVAPAVWGGITGDLDDQTDLSNALAAKQDTISDLATIQSGAAAGATAVQPGDLATVATSGDYDDLLNKPSIPAAPGTLQTDLTAAQSTSASEALSGAIKLHKVSKTGDYGDLNNKPTIPAAQVNSDWDAVSGVAQILNKPTIPSAPGTLNTDNSTAQTTSSSEALSGAVKLHKVSKTGSYNDLLNKPTIPSAPGTLDTTATTAQATNASEALSGAVTLHKIAKTGTYSDLIGTPSIPVVESLTNAEIDTIWAAA